MSDETDEGGAFNPSTCPACESDLATDLQARHNEDDGETIVETWACYADDCETQYTVRYAAVSKSTDFTGGYHD